MTSLTFHISCRLSNGDFNKLSSSDVLYFYLYRESRTKLGQIVCVLYQKIFKLHVIYETFVDKSPFSVSLLTIVFVAKCRICCFVRFFYSAVKNFSMARFVLFSGLNFDTNQLFQYFCSQAFTEHECYFDLTDSLYHLSKCRLSTSLIVITVNQGN